MKYRIFKENKLVIASHNQGKIKEIRELLHPLNIEILSAYDLKIEEPEENGCTFEENALIKSSFVSKATSLPCLSDDSGICFSDLNNEPGIHSARWAGKNKDFNLAMFKINKEIKKINNPNYNVISFVLCLYAGLIIMMLLFQVVLMVNFHGHLKAKKDLDMIQYLDL